MLSHERIRAAARVKAKIKYPHQRKIKKNRPTFNCCRKPAKHAVDGEEKGSFFALRGTSVLR